MSSHRGEGEPLGWTRDHVLVMQAASNLDAAPEYARQLWETAGDPAGAAMELLAMLVRERAAILRDVTP